MRRLQETEMLRKVQTGELRDKLVTGVVEVLSSLRPRSLRTDRADIDQGNKNVALILIVAC